MGEMLNVILSDRIIRLIQGFEHSGQFIFSTHNLDAAAHF
jgi:hypothetical protein